MFFNASDLGVGRKWQVGTSWRGDQRFPFFLKVGSEASLVQGLVVDTLAIICSSKYRKWKARSEAPFNCPLALIFWRLHMGLWLNIPCDHLGEQEVKCYCRAAGEHPRLGIGLHYRARLARPRGPLKKGAQHVHQNYWWFYLALFISKVM